MKKLPNLVDMRRDPEKNFSDMPSFSQNPYPYGLCITLCNEELEKLGLDPEDCEIGDLLEIHALAKVTSVSSNDREGQDGPCHRVEMTLTHFADEDADDAEDSNKKPGLRGLYK